jgi:hypothetical protein
VLNVDHTRHLNLQHIKDNKSRSFAHRFNENNLHINQSNLKFLNKLENVKSFARYTSYTASDRPAVQHIPKPIPALTKRRIIETEKENSRIFFRMRSVSSNLSKDRLLSDYAKAEKIKSRITKYALSNNKVALKYILPHAGLRSIFRRTRVLFRVVLCTATLSGRRALRPSTRRRTS